MGSEACAHEQERQLASLAERYRLPREGATRLCLLLRSLVEDPLAPTSVRSPAKAIDDHLADSLVALELEVARSAKRVVDVGSGAGLPGLPLAIALPEAQVALVDSAARRCAFLERARRRCRASNARVIHTRVESWHEGLGSFDLVIARALAPLPVVVEYAAPLLILGGSLVVWRGRRDARGESAAARAAAELGIQPREVRAVQPYPGAEHRHLHLMLKVMDTPPRFPRRPGIALKHPLGAS